MPEMVRTAEILERAGADMLLMPCNLAHAYLDDVQRMVRIPFLNMIEETVKFIVANYPRHLSVGLIASTPTIDLRIYETAFRRHSAVAVVAPDREVQESKVMKAIYGDDGLKSGHKTGPRELLTQAAQSLINRGAELIIAGCTEVSLVLNQQSSPFVVIDPLEVVARVAIESAMRGEAASTPHQAVATGRS